MLLSNSNNKKENKKLDPLKIPYLALYNPGYRVWKNLGLTAGYLAYKKEQNEKAEKYLNILKKAYNFNTNAERNRWMRMKKKSERRPKIQVDSAHPPAYRGKQTETTVLRMYKLAHDKEKAIKKEDTQECKIMFKSVASAIAYRIEPFFNKCRETLDANNEKVYPSPTQEKLEKKSFQKVKNERQKLVLEKQKQAKQMKDEYLKMKEAMLESRREYLAKVGQRTRKCIPLGIRNNLQK